MVDFKHIQTEIDAGYLYLLLSKHEDDDAIAEVFRQMSEIEYSHARAFMEKNKLDTNVMPSPSMRAKTLEFIGRVVGYDYILGILLDTEKRLSSSVLAARKVNKMAGSVSDTAHVAILKNIINYVPEIWRARMWRVLKKGIDR